MEWLFAEPWRLMAAGFVLLVIGGETLVRGAASAAKALGVSPLLIGITLVGFGTSTPELVTSLQAAQAGSPGIAFGNVVGSNIANVLLILGLAGLMRPIPVDARAFRRDAPVLLLATAACIGAVIYGRLDQRIGLGFLAVLLLYVLITFVQERRFAALPEGERLEHEAAAKTAGAPRFWPSLLLAVFGIGVTIFGAGWLVRGAVEFSREMGVSDTVVGLTVVAVGTSLPELVTSVVAALKRQSDVAFGNVVGSNIYNVLGILGITALAAPIPAPPELLRLDVWVMAASALAVVWFVRRGRLGRGQGLLLLAAYAAYVGWLAWTA